MTKAYRSNLTMA